MRLVSVLKTWQRRTDRRRKIKVKEKKEIMNKEQKIEASPLPPPIEGGQERAISNNRAVSIAPDISGQAVGFSQRNRKHDINKGLQPHILKMWLKPVSLFSNSFRRLKPTACPDFSGAIDKMNFNSFLNSQQQCASTPPPAGGGQGGFVNRKLGLPADNFFNN